MQASVKNMQGREVRKVDLPGDIFSVKPNRRVLHQVIVSMQSNKRQGTHATKTRAFVSGTGKKPFRQKGTGSARQGSRRSPLMCGGAIVHGPQPRSYRKCIPQKYKQLALKVMLSDRVRSGSLHVVDSIAIKEYKTKSVVGMLKTLKLERVLLSDDVRDDFLHRSTRNIYKASVRTPQMLNALDVAGHDNLLLTEAALQTLITRLSQSDGKESEGEQK